MYHDPDQFACADMMFENTLKIYVQVSEDLAECARNGFHELAVDAMNELYGMRMYATDPDLLRSIAVVFAQYPQYVDRFTRRDRRWSEANAPHRLVLHPASPRIFPLRLWLAPKHRSDK